MKRHRKVFLLAIACALPGLWPAPAHALTYYFAVDVPSHLGGADFLTSQFVRNSLGAYALETSLPAGTAIAAVHRRGDGSWIFAPAHPVTLLGTNYEPRDLVGFNGVAFAMLLDGSAAGIPESARIDAVTLEPGGRFVFSLDVPVILGGVIFSRSDLLVGSGPFGTYWDAEGAGVPASANLVGVDLDGAGALVVTFDVPTTLSGADHLPGSLVRWTGAGFVSHYVDPTWPRSSLLRDFAFAAASGAVPNGTSVPGTTLTVTQGGGGMLNLTWGTSCSQSDSDYEVYEGKIGSWASHAPRTCSTNGMTSWALLPSQGDTYYLIVPHNLLAEGSYGLMSNGSPRLPAPGACLPQSVGCQ